MEAAFVHDHRFPLFNGKYYASSGFDNAFIKRYLDIFGSVKIIAREEVFKKTPEFETIENENVCFYTLLSSKKLLCRNVRLELKNELLECKYAVIRVPSILGLMAENICRKNHIPYLTEVVGCPKDALAVKGIKGKITGIIYSGLMKRMIKHSNYTVYVSEEFLEKKYPTDGVFTNISNIILNNYGTCDLEERKRKIQIYNPKKGLLIGTCASVDTVYKGQEEVIRILPRLAEKGINVKYQLAGGGSPSRLASVAARYGVSERVEFLGELSHENVFSWMDTLDIYVHPSKTEGLCRAVIEAMSRACPIIASDAGGIYEQIDDKYIYPKDDGNKLFHLLVGFDKNAMMQQAYANYCNAQKYESTILDKRRRDFFGKLTEE